MHKMAEEDKIPWEENPMLWLKHYRNFSFETPAQNNAFNKNIAKRLIVKKFFSTLHPAINLDLLNMAY
jgi:hypothetical protein